MSICNICERKETRNRELLMGTNICTECTEKIKNHNYEIIDNKDESISKELCDIVTPQSEMSENQNSICSDDAKEKMADIQLEQKLEFNSNSDYKDALLASLYSQVEFLKQELEEKNLLIRTLIIKESEVYKYYAESTTDSETNSSSSSIHENINKTSIYTDAPMLSANEDIPDDNDLDDEIDFHDLYLQYVKDMEEENREKSRRKQVEDVLIYLQNVKEEKNNHTRETESQNERIKWLKHSTGAATKIMEKMGYKGKGLGKTENGILEPITIHKSHLTGATNNKQEDKKDSLVILSDSMLNQLQEDRISKKYNVKVLCHGGCTTRCMYSHVKSALKLKPKYIILNVGTNDSVDNTSDDILRNLLKLKRYIENLMPFCEVIISLPTVRVDNNKANQILKNLNLKLKRTKYRLLDNSNIKVFHLGKKGLHLNSHGAREIASNIISLTKRL